MLHEEPATKGITNDVIRNTVTWRKSRDDDDVHDDGKSSIERDHKTRFAQNYDYKVNFATEGGSQGVADLDRGYLSTSIQHPLSKSWLLRRAPRH